MFLLQSINFGGRSLKYPCLQESISEWYRGLENSETFEFHLKIYWMVIMTWICIVWNLGHYW